MAGLADLFAPEDYDPKAPPLPNRAVPVRPFGELKPLDADYYRNMPVMDKVSNIGRTLGQAVGFSPTQSHRMGEDTKNLIGFVPGVGDAVGAVEAKESLLHGDIGKGLLQAGLTAIGVVPGVGDLAAKAGREGVETLADTMTAAVKPGIKAYHGSPHSFDRFDMSKIGTGEGAQAYGHGLYFAENEGVAKSYRDTLANDYFETADKRLWSPDAIEHLNVRSLLNRTGDIDQALKKANDLLPGANEQTLPMLQGDIARLEELKAKGGIKRGTSGSMYEVNIDADPEQFLDWDKPLSEQSETVRKTLADNWLAHPETHAEQSGSEIYHQAQNSILRGDVLPGAADDVPLEHLQAQVFREAGIPGIKYLDAGSRVGGDAEAIIKNYGSREKALEVAEARLKSASMGDIGYWQKITDQLRAPESKNYVVFDDKLISIVKKYGIPAALGAGLITEEMARQMQEQGIGGA